MAQPMTKPRREPLRPVRLFGTFFRVSALNELQYRANFAVQVFQSVIALVTGLAVLALVFGQTTDLAGWTQSELLAVMGVHFLMGGVIGAAVQPNMERLMGDVRQGTLDFILTKPEDSQVLVSVREFRVWRLVDVVIGAIVLVVALVQIEGAVGLPSALAFGFALILGAVMIYCFWLILTTAAFWIVRMDEIHELWDGIYQSGRWPVAIYPGWLRISLTYLVPIAFALVLISRWWWRFGLKRYAGASA